MKINCNKAFNKILLLLFVLYGYVAHAGPPEVDPPIDDTPIDGNIIILVFAAVLFGVYTIYNYKVKQKRPV